MTAPQIAVSRLSIRDGAGRALVDDVSFSVARGEALVLIGETGSGKSLIAQAMMGLLPPGLTAEGTLALAGRPPIPLAQRAGLHALWSRETLLLPQEPAAALDPTMRLGRQLAVAGGGSSAPPAEALAAVDLPHAAATAYPFELSGGMAQRALVAVSLRSGAQVIIADEPTKGLDRARIALATELLQGLVERGRTLLVITHDLAVARGLGGRVIVLREGRVVEQGSTANVLAAPEHPYTRDWLAADPLNWPLCQSCIERDDIVLAGHQLGFAWPRSRPLFDGIDLHLPRGGVLALLGASGSGKTTLGNILIGLRPPMAGEVSWAGADPYRDPRARRRLRLRYQKLHQDPGSAFLPSRSVGQQLADLREVVPTLDIAQALPPLMDRLRLSPALLARYPGEISGGEAQRLALARVLLLQPDMILADEPTSRLDPIVQRETMLLLREIVTEGRMGLFLISHDLALVRAVADEVLTLA